MKSVRCTGVWAALAVLLFPGFVLAGGGDWNPGGPATSMIELGTGARANSNRTVDVLLSLEFRGVPGEGDVGVGNGAISVAQLYWARINADVAFGFNGNAVPAFDVRLIPVVMDHRVFVPGDHSMRFGSLQGLEMRMSRNFHVGRDFAFDVRVLGYRTGMAIPHGTSGFNFIGAIAVDALGYKLIDHVEGATYHGARIGSAAIEFGEMLRLGEIDSTIALVLGAEADFSLGGNGGFAVQSDMAAYASLRFDVKDFLRLFFEVRGEAYGESGGRGWTTIGSVMAGARFYF